MPNSYSHKKSSVPSKVPANNDILVAEIAINLADRVLHSKDTANNIFLVKADPLYNTGLQDKLDLKSDLASPTFTGNTSASNVSITGTLLVTSTAQVTNLNADFLDGEHGTFYTSNSIFASHTSNLSNPHVVTTTQLNLQNVTNESKLTMFTNPVFTNPSYEGTLTGNTGVINIGSGQLYKAASGKIGINTDNPISLLTLKGTTETDAPILGPELLSTGGWTVNSGWTGTNPFTHTSGTDTLTHNFVVGVGNLYQFTLTMTGRNAGGVTLTFGGLTTQSYTTSAAVGTIAFTTGGVVITPTTDFDGTITVSCKQITSESTPLLTLQDSSGDGRFELRTNLLGNVLIGRGSGRYITTGLYNTGVGDNTLSHTMGGDFNVGVGSYALYNNTEGGYNTGVGVNTLGSTTLGSYNAAYGTQTMLYNTIGSYNSAYGYQSMQTNLDGNFNASFGYESLFTNLSGSYNSVFGPLAGYSITIGEKNVAFGYKSMYYNQDGDDNIAIGHAAGSFQNDGTTPLIGIGESIYIGTDSRGSANGEINAIVIGYNSLGKGTNTTVIGNANTASTYIFGNLALGSTSTPTEKLDVTGSIKASGNVSSDILISTVASGTAPIKVTSDTLVTNLNADLLDGQHGTYYTSNSIFAFHTANVSNPHVVTATQVGLGNVTNESKETLFTTPTFTGVTASANTFTSTVATGNSPFIVDSTTMVTNLNADLLDGQQGTYYTTNSIFGAHTSNTSNPHVVTATQVGLGNVTNESKATLFTTPTFTGVTTSANTFTSTVATGNAPFIVDSTTMVSNLNADLLDGQHGTYYTTNSIFGAHTSNTSNPHVVTAFQVGLGNVTNESKATMFTDSVLTGIPTAPTALVATSNTQIATTAFVHSQVAIDKELTGYASNNGVISSSDTILSAIEKLNGNDTLKDFVTFKANPTGVPSTNGTIFWSEGDRALIVKSGDVTQQLGQEELVLCWNSSSNTIFNGSVVYPYTSENGMPSVRLAIATAQESSRVIGVATEDIEPGTSGFVTNRGIVHDMDTSLLTAGWIYLSDTVAGGVTSTAPTDVNSYSIRVGGCLTVDASTGSIYVLSVENNRLTDMSDVTLTLPVTDDVLKYNGSEWINGPSSAVTAGQGTTFFLDDTVIVNSAYTYVKLDSLKRIPSALAQDYESVSVTGNVGTLSRFLDITPLDGTEIEGGTWFFNLYPIVDNISGVSFITACPCRVLVGTGTVTMTGTGASRIATVTGSSPFLSTDYSASPVTITDSLIQTANGLLRISAVTSNTVVTVVTGASDYANETSVPFSIWRVMFTSDSNEINSTTPSLNSFHSEQAPFPISATDKLGVAFYGRTDSPTKLITLYYGGSTHASSFTSPFTKRHNDLSGLQGGLTAERYHLSLDKYNVVQNTTNTNSGDQTNISGNASTATDADKLDGEHGTYYTANSIFAAHTSNVANPHATTALQVGLENVTNESKATLFTSPTFTGVTTTANTFTSTVAIGNSPFVVTSNTLVTNLNADLLDGQHGSYYTTANNLTGTIPSAVLPNSGVTANTYGSLTTIPVITVNAKGLVTGVSTATVAGAVLQVVNATYSTSTGNNSGSYVNTGLTASITPTSASSKIFVFGVVNGTNSQGSTATGIQMGLYKGTSATIIANLGTYLTYNTSSTNNYAGSVSFGYQDSPNTTSAVTYGVAFLRSIGSGNIYVQLDSSVSSITLMEIAG